jgi:hypothetical protein
VSGSYAARWFFSRYPHLSGSIAPIYGRYEALKHRHKHYHVMHPLHRGENWGHLVSTDADEHTRNDDHLVRGRTLLIAAMKTWSRR